MGDLKAYATPGQLISPAAKIYLIRHKLKAINIKATGRRGMLLKQDIVEYLKNPAKYANKGTSQAELTSSTPKSSFKISKPSGQDQVVKLDTAMMKRMSRIMTQSKTIPSFVFTDEYDLTDLLEFEKTHYAKMTMILKSISIALSKFPSMNTIVNPDVDEDGYIHEYVFKKDHNISVAHSISEGLSLPYIPKVQTLTLLDIEKALSTVLDGKIDEDRSKESTFTIYFNESGSNFYPNIIRPQT